MTIIKSQKLFFLFSLAGLLVLFLLNVAVGSSPISVASSLAALVHPGAEPATSIVWILRLPKAVTCLLVGGGLAVSGLMMQSIFRNPLAGPDVLGLSSGASLAVAVVILAGRMLPIPLTLPWLHAAAATIGCLVIFLIMAAVASRMRSSVSLLIVGLMTAATTTSITAILQYVSHADDLQAYIIWTMGSVGGTRWPEIAVLAFFIGAGCLIALTQLKPLNAWVLGEGYAQSIGINVTRSRMMIMFATSLITGSITAFCGPISFVGLAVPHLVRIGAPTMRHQQLIPLVIITGATLVLTCDLLAQLPGASQVLPLNAVTALLGAPVVIWVLMRSKRIEF